MSTDSLYESNNCLGTTHTHCQFFELIRFNAFMVKYQEPYWIKTNAEWTTVQEHDRTKKTVMNDTKSNIATRFEIFPTVAHDCGSPKPIHKTKYGDIYILYEYGFDMNTVKLLTKQKHKLENDKFLNKTEINNINPYTI